jgi:thioredoxin-dependent peroxiredoxin
VILGASPQGAESHSKFALKHQLNFPLLVDEDRKLAAMFGALDKRTRSTFVIDPDGKIEQAIYGVKVKGHVDSLKESLLT